MEVIVKEDNGKLIAERLHTAIEIGLEEIGIAAEGDVVGYMEKEHIIDTGNLIGSITHRVLNDESAVIVGTNVEYALYVHNGTSKMAGRPYLTQPIQENKEKYRKLLESEMKSS